MMGAKLSGKAFYKAFTPANITEGFCVTGLCPNHYDVFDDDAVMSASITDQFFINAEQNENNKKEPSFSNASNIAIDTAGILQAASSGFFYDQKHSTSHCNLEKNFSIDCVKSKMVLFSLKRMTPHLFLEMT